MITTRTHAFSDDALGSHDAVALTELLRSGDVSQHELATAALTRAAKVDPQLCAVAGETIPPRYGEPTARLFGIPTFIKDNTDVAGVPTNHGSEAFRAHPARRDDPYARQYLSTGLTLLGKSRLPEFGFNASTEFMTAPPVRNPWHTDYLVGASSGGAAALVASGVVPIAHANDGGGSIRIPAACAGLVGLKPSRHRHIDGTQARQLPINVISQGVLTRSVRDTAMFVAATEDHWRNPLLPPIGEIHGPARRRLRIGLILDSVTDASVDEATRAALEQTAVVLEQAGHIVEPTQLPVSAQFADDFVQYWGLLADLAVSTGRITFDRHFDTARIDGLTHGLRRLHRQRLARTPAALVRLRRTPRLVARLFTRHELILSPVLAHATPKLGFLAPTVAFDELLSRLLHYVAYTPLNNIAGTPAISLPAALTSDGVPVGVQLSAAYGDERTLLETAYLIEALRPFPRITDPAP